MSDGSRRNLTGIMAAVVTAVLALGGGMYLWTERNGDQLTDRNLRELARIGREIEGRLANLHTVLGNLAKAADSAEVEDRARLVPNLSLLAVGAVSLGPRGTELTLLPGLDSIDLTYRGPLGPKGNGPDVRISARWSLEPLGPALVSEYFQTTLLADGRGRVVLSAPGATGIHVNNLSSLLDSIPGKEGEPGSAGSAARAVTQIRSATIAGRSYLVFVQPLRLSAIAVADEAGPTQWSLAGIVPMNRFSQEKLALGPAVVLLLGLFLTIGLLAWPFMRAASMGPRERLRVRHLLALVASLALTSGGVGLGLADLRYYGGLRRDVFRQTGLLADSLQGSLTAEIRAAVGEVQGLTERLQTQARAAVRDSMARLPWMRAPTRADSTALDAVRLRAGLPRDSFGDYPVLTMAYWIDPSGQQVAKWTARPTNTSLVSVARRDYYNVIRTQRGWPLYPDSAASAPYFVESIRTWTTDEKSAAISTDVSPGARAGAHVPGHIPWVGVTLTNLASLDHPVLPAGVSFTVVGADGQALFHARKERALEENLVEETGGDDVLRATLMAHARRDLDVVYRGRRNRLYVRPLPGAPISLVVMLDKAHLETAHFETVFASATLFLAYCVLMMVWFVLVELVVPRKMHWLWPDPAHPGKYLALGIVLLLFAATLFLPLRFSRVFGNPLALLLVPFQGLGLGLVALSIARSYDLTMRRARLFGGALAAVTTVGVVLTLSRASAVGMEGARSMLVVALVASALAFGVVHLEYLVDRDRSALPGVLGLFLETPWRILRNALGRERRAVRLYVASMVAGLLLVGVLPGYALYQFAFRDRLDLLVRADQVAVLEGLRARSRRHDAMVEAAHLRGFDLALDSIAYDTFFGSLPFGICRPGRETPEAAACRLRGQAGPEARARLPESLDDLVPYLSEASLAMRGLRSDQPDRTWVWTDADPGPWLVARGDTLGSQLPYTYPHPGVLWWLGLLGGIGLLWWLVRWMSRRVFLIDLWASPPLQLRDVLLDTGREGNLLVVCTRSTDRSVLHEPPDGWQVIDLMDDTVGTGDEPVLERGEETSVLCIDHADHRAKEGAWGRALLSFLEPMVYDELRPTRIILLTSQEPSELLGPAMQDPEAAVYAERWTRMLGQFTRVAVRDGSRDATFKEELIDVARAKKSRAARRAARAAIPLLRKECRRPPLERIGLHILETLPEGGMAKSELIARIRWEADTYYEALWTVLGKREKLVVAQLASGSVVNPSLSGSVARLLGRGILERGPELRAMNQSFETFVRDRAPDATIRRWEMDGASSTWQLIRLPFVFGWVALALFLFWTQRDLLGNTITFLTTAGVGLAAIGRMVTLFQSGLAAGGKGKSEG